uniref:Zinc finger protein 26 n=1 Tax=Cacopsylla melanoneura TaxID=428564 RepID=A0A8D8X3P4_9HEMI
MKQIKLEQFLVEDSSSDRSIRAGAKPLFPCDECNEVLTSKMGIKRHKMLYHQCVQCPLCHETFSNHVYNAYHQHQACMTSTTITINNEDNTTYHCPVCDKTFSKLKSLKRHILMHTSKNPVRCGYCGQFYLDVARLARHIRLRHSTNKMPYHDCDLCNKRYMSLHKFEIHKRKHIVEEKKLPRFHCIYCSNKYAKLGHFKEHLRLKHGNRSITRNMTCGICQNTHMMRDDIGANLIYICDSCQRELAIQDLIQPSGSKYFDCLSCAKTFKRTVALYRHILNFHTPAICYKCNTTYESLRNLVRHDRRIHQDMALACPQCGLWFRNRIYLRKHMVNRHSPYSYVRQYCRLFQKYYRMAKGTIIVYLFQNITNDIKKIILSE